MNELHTVVEDVFAEKQKPGTRPTTLQLHTYLTQNKFAQLPLHPWVEYRRIIWREDIHANLLRALCYRWIGTAP
jgi:hypothetical protein